MMPLSYHLNAKTGILETSLGRLQFTTDEENAEICGIEVENRRKGNGTALIAYFEEFCKVNGLTSILVPSLPTKIAISFWLKNGFRCYFSDDKKLVKRILNKKKVDHITNTDSGIIALRKELV